MSSLGSIFLVAILSKVSIIFNFFMECPCGFINPLIYRGFSK
jgi:hypothetical protein